MTNAYYIPNSAFAKNITFDETTCAYSLKDNATYVYQFSAPGTLMESCSPMSAKLSLKDTEYSTTIEFEHEVAMIRIRLNKVSEYASGDLILTNGTTWSATVEFANEYEGSGSMIFDIPIPVGDKTYTATIENTNGGTATIGSKETTATNPVKGQIIDMKEVDYSTLKFTSTFTPTVTIEKPSNPQSEEA